MGIVRDNNNVHSVKIEQLPLRSYSLRDYHMYKALYTTVSMSFSMITHRCDALLNVYIIGKL